MTATIEQTQPINLWDYATPGNLERAQREKLMIDARKYALAQGRPRVARAVASIIGTSVAFDRAEVTTIEGGSIFQQDMFVDLRVGENLWMRTRVAFRADGTSWIASPWLHAVCLNCGAEIDADGNDADNLSRLRATLDYCSCGPVDAVVAA